MLTVIITLDSVTCIVNDHGLKTAASYGLFSAEGFSDLIPQFLLYKDGLVVRLI